MNGHGGCYCRKDCTSHAGTIPLTDSKTAGASMKENWYAYSSLIADYCRETDASLVDSFDALVTHRPYRKALSKEKALQSLYHEADHGRLDSRIVECLFNMVINAEERDYGKWDELNMECFLDLQLSVPAGSNSYELSV